MLSRMMEAILSAVKRFVKLLPTPAVSSAVVFHRHGSDGARHAAVCMAHDGAPGIGTGGEAPGGRTGVRRAAVGGAGAEGTEARGKFA